MTLHDELRNYRSHHFRITRLDSGDLALMDPYGNYIAHGPWSQLAGFLLSGPAHYETCVESWASKPRFQDVPAARQLLLNLGLTKPAEPFKRRI